MIPILGSALLGILFAVFLVLKIKKKVGLTKTSEILSMIGWLGVFFALVFGFLGLIAAAILTVLLPDQSYQTLNRVQLYGTRSSVVSSGELFLGIGTVDGSLAYKVNYPDPDQANAYHPDILRFYDPVHQVTILEEDRTDGYLEIFDRTCDNFLENGTDLGNWTICNHTKWYVFHVPKGSVDRTFNL